MSACGADDATSGGPLGSGQNPVGQGSPGGTMSGGTTGGTGSPGGTGSLGGTGGTGGTGGGAGGTTGGVTPFPEGTCERVVTKAGPVSPDIMIVLDRSGSMLPEIDPKLDCRDIDLRNIFDIFKPNYGACASNGIDCSNAQYQSTTPCGGPMTLGIDRWNPAVRGLKSITSQFQDKISFGLTTFPGNQGSDSCSAGTERVPVAVNSAAQIASALDMTTPRGATPTGPTLKAVREQIAGKMTSPDAVLPPQYVLLVTDGQPTCPEATRSNPNAAVQNTLAELDALLKAGIKTYVIGYDASVDAKLAQALTEFAQRGGTEKFYPVQDEASLVDQFKVITGTVAACTYTLDSVPKNPDYVKVTIDSEQVFLGQGFTLQGANVILEGATCDKLRDGAVHVLDVSVECEPQVPIL